MNARVWSGSVVAVVCALSGSALGQMNSVPPYHAVVTVDDAALRCGSSDSIGLLSSMYQVAKLQRGQVLKVDGEAQGWARVAYPAGVWAFVPADSAAPDAGGQSVALTKPIRLKAPNAVLGLKGSWKDALDQPLPVGTKLNIAEAEAAADGRGNTAWKVVPPETARLFIPSTTIRKASPEEVSAFQAAAGRAPAPAPQPVAAAPVPQPAATPAPVRPAAAPVTTVQTPPAGDPPPPATIAMPPVAPAPVGSQPQIRPHTPVAAAPAAATPRLTAHEKLEAAFEAVRKQSPESAEYSELLSEFESALARLSPDEPTSAVLRTRIKQRVDFLRLKADLQARQREFAAASEAVAQDEKRLAQKLAEVDAVRQYTIVGRLSASTIYDGKRLPLMYRIQAVGGVAPRTLAYVKPDEALKVETRLGQVVGVIGEAVLDPTLKLNIITPLRIDALEAAPSVETPAPAPAAPQEPTTDARAEPKPKPKAEAKAESRDISK